MADHGRFGPAAIVRAARFGVDRLRGLDSRAALWARTRDDPRFQRALTVSNPGLAEFVEGLDPRGPRGKRIVGAERTLYRYLARAVGRTEPCDAWAGVAVARFGARTAVEAGPQRVAVAPDLRPFAALLAALGRRPEVRRIGRYAANPTVRLDPDALRWETPDGSRSLPPIPALRSLVRALDRAPAQYSAWEQALTGVLTERCLDQGLLVGGARLPALYEDAWDALHRVELPLDLAGPWSACVRGLRAIARELVDFDAMAPADIRARLGAARSHVRVLFAAADEPPPELPRTVLRFDLGLAAEITLGPEIRARLDRALDPYARFQRDHALGPRLLRASVDQLGVSGPRRLGTPTGSALADLTDPIARWEALIRGSGVADDGGEGLSDLAPIAAFLVALSPGGEPVITGTSDQATAPYARFASLLGTDELRRWLRAELACAADSTGIDLAALGSRFASAPNALAQPVLADAVVDPWGADPDAVDLRGAEVRLEQGVPLLFAPHHPRPLAVFGFSAADLGSPVDALLRLTSFVPEGGRFSKPAAVGFPIEQDGRPSAQVRLADGSVVRPRRTVLTARDRAALAEDPERAWADLAARHDWPERVAVRVGRDPELLIPRDSPIAVDAALHDAPPDRVVAVEEPPDTAWLELEGERHVAQLAVPFVRARHAWSGLRLDHAEPGARSNRPALGER